MAVQSATLSLSDPRVKAAGISIVDSTELYPDLHLTGNPALPMLVVDNALGRAVIALQGAHVMAFRAAGQREMLWVSPKCVLEAGKPIRGGIPLCLPWFGPGPDGKTLHGFARTMPWSLVAAEKLSSGATRLALELTGDASTSAMWPHAFAFRLEVVVGSELQISIAAENRGTDAAPFAFAFHTYFAVPDVAQARVAGLAGTTLIDKMDNFARKQQQGEVTIAAVTDRIFLDVARQQTVESSAGSVRIESDSRCALVWNAWTNDKNMFDLGEGNHVGYICVERGDFADFAVTLTPGGKYATSMTLSY
jgi:D-hexose-6-phosphate mutarotase